MGGRAGKARITDDKRRIVLFFGFEYVQQRHRMRFGRVASNQEDRLGVVNIIVAVSHGTVAPCVGHTGNRC